MLYPLSYEGVRIAYLQGFLGGCGRDLLPGSVAQRLFSAVLAAAHMCRYVRGFGDRLRQSLG